MSDEIDLAQQREAEFREDALAAFARRTATATRASASHCVGCGESIPEGRRRTLPGVQLCIDCQRDAERRI